jgi:hypothetical protein
VWEAVLNLTGITSVSEISTGGGYLISGLKYLFDGLVVLSASEVRQKQIEVSEKIFPIYSTRWMFFVWTSQGV